MSETHRKIKVLISVISADGNRGAELEEKLSSNDEWMEVVRPCYRLENLSSFDCVISGISKRSGKRKPLKRRRTASFTEIQYDLDAANYDCLVSKLREMYTLLKEDVDVTEELS